MTIKLRDSRPYFSFASSSTYCISFASSQPARFRRKKTVCSSCLLPYLPVTCWQPMLLDINRKLIQSIGFQTQENSFWPFICHDSTGSRKSELVVAGNKWNTCVSRTVNYVDYINTDSVWDTTTAFILLTTNRSADESRPIDDRMPQVRVEVARKRLRREYDEETENKNKRGC
jgi:hypothetical protein